MKKIIILSLIYLSAVSHAQTADIVPLPEQATATRGDVSAFYAGPTKKYVHGILGDVIEAEQLIVKRKGSTYRFTLPNNEVFEDIKPRLHDVDNDGELEFITIRSDINNGAGIAIYKLIGDKLTEYASVANIGRRNRWLNIAAIADLNNDGKTEIAWVQTPHIGGILKVASIHKGKLKPFTTRYEFVSNHAIGERNLDLSILSEKQGEKILYLPTQNRDKILGFQLLNNEWIVKERISQTVDFSLPLRQQCTNL